ncbi:MAG: glycosyl transferase, partial [Rhodococcus sp. (in: high G+C Gram-positive bacteria)]|nr:glycosyl transferase [Rhodococcus sp. (in: high G+C Gram-positive bacteria)]MDX5451242.1 glycosyl transferase [Rhodococcus sp. (in: high G+C Gram-positive bacteria)]
LLTPWPFQQAGSAAERLVQPLLFWSWFATLPIAVSHRSNRPSMAVSCGQFLVFDASAYAAVGGHVAVAASPTEDLDLARALRRSGRRTMVAAAGNLASCRMYEGAAPLRAGYTRWLWSAFGSPAGSAAVLVAAAVTYVLPPVAVVLGPGPARRWGVVGTAAAIVSRTVARATERGSPDRSDVAAGCTHPFGVCAFAALAIDSLRARRTGRLGWKDRPLP